MLIKILVIYFTLYIYVENQSVCNKIRETTLISDFLESTVYMKNKLREFFRLSLVQKFASIIKKIIRKMKKRINNFVYDETNCTMKDNLVLRIAAENIKEPQMSTIQLIFHHGYEAEAHTVHTLDGFMLRLHRILPTSKSTTVNRIVILHHGLMGSSDDWLLVGPKKALAYLLIEAGYDVWLTNARGNKYSSFRAGASDNSSEFWNFSFHDIGTLDLPAVIDYIKEKSESDSEINFVGFSMGATSLLVLLSSQPQYNQVLNSATLLAPLAFMYQIKGPLKVLAELYGQNARNSLNFLGVNEFMPIEAFPSEVIEKYCRGDVRLCRNLLLLIANGGKEIRNKNIMENVLGHLKAGTSIKTIMHLLQLVNSDQFQMYDYGAQVNLKTYGLKVPPEYNISNVRLPIVLFSSLYDWLSTYSNMLRLLLLLPNVAVHHVVRRQNFTHTDFIWGEEAPDEVFELVVEVLGYFSKRNT